MADDAGLLGGVGLRAIRSTLRLSHQLPAFRCSCCGAWAGTCSHKQTNSKFRRLLTWVQLVRDLHTMVPSLPQLPSELVAELVQGLNAEGTAAKDFVLCHCASALLKWHPENYMDQVGPAHQDQRRTASVIMRGPCAQADQGPGQLCSCHPVAS